MGIKATFAKGVERIFTAFGDVVKEGIYVLTDDDGWGNVTTISSNPMRVITDKFEKEDLEKASFSELVQHTDTKGLVPAVDFTSQSLIPKTGKVFKVDDVEFTIEAFDTDPAEAMYTLLLRNTV